MTAEEKRAYRREQWHRMKEEENGIFRPAAPKKSNVWTVNHVLAWERVTLDLRRKIYK